MPNNEITPNDEVMASQFLEGVNELSDEELDAIAGGISFTLDIAQFSTSSFESNQDSLRAVRNPGIRPVSKAQTTKSSLFRLKVIDATADELRALGGLFGSISRIEGDD
jgi:hypothetical protein